MGFGLGAGIVGMGLFWLVVVGLVVWAVASLYPKDDDRRERPPTARDILDARLARGEIDVANYRERRAG